MEFLAVAVDKLWKYTMEPIARQVGYVIFYHSNVYELKMEVVELRHARERVQHEVDAAERNGELVEGDVRDWLKKVDETILKVDELNKDERHASTVCSCRSIPNLLFRHKLSRQSKKMKEEIFKIKKRNFDSVSYTKVPGLTRLSSLITRNEQISSRISVLNNIMDALKDPSVHMIGLYGLGGVGKTTLVKEVAEKAQQKKLFDVVILAYVTLNPEMKGIQDQIADKLGLKFKEESISGRADRLYDRFIKKDERILVILDDLWAELKLDEIGIPSVKQHKGLKILMTSRDRAILSNKLNTQKDFLLQSLAKDEAWKLFVYRAQFDVSSVSGELLSIAVKIAEECGGLPLAIVTVASLLKEEKSITLWKDVLRRLQNPAPVDVTDIETKIYKSIEVSYENLENDLLRSIFLLCGEMVSISSITDMFKISVGLGLFKNIYTMEDGRNSFDRCIHKLKDLSLLEESDFGDGFVMHDVVQDVAMFLAKKNQHLFMKSFEELQEWPGKDQLENCRTIIFHRSKIDELLELLHCPNLTFFHLESENSSFKMPDNFFEGMYGLKVLNLVGNGFNSLPRSFTLLSNLCTLRLDLVSLVSEDITIIGELKGLKVLTLSYENLLQLPQELGQLTQLQLLDLMGCYRLNMIPPNVLSKFRKLEELYLPDYIQWYISDPNNQQSNASLGELNVLPRLKTLKVCVDDERMFPKDLDLERLQMYDITIGRIFLPMFVAASRKLELNLSTSIHLWHNVKKLLVNSVENLYLKNLKGAENVVPGINEGMLQLKQLSMSSNHEMQTIVESFGLNHAIDIFPNLEMLNIRQATNLKRLWNGPLSGESFSRLKDISVVDCPNMKNLFLVFTVTEEITLVNEKVLHFPELCSLTLQDLPELISFCCEDETDSYSQLMRSSTDTRENNSCSCIGLFNDKVICPSLEEITIRYVLKLNTIWHWQRQLRPQSFDKLRKLVIQGCWELITIFPYHIGSRFQSLETLLIINCKSLEQIFDLQGGNAGVPGTMCFPNLRHMHVSTCRRLKYFFPASVAINLSKLQKLKVKKCPMMEDITIKDENTYPSSNYEVLFSNLEELIITDMDKLNTVCKWQQLLSPISLGKLTKVEAINCPEFVFPSHVKSAIQSLEKLRISNCKYAEPVSGETLGTISVLFFYPNLQEIHVGGCDWLPFLFSSSMATSLDKLRKLVVGACSMMEEIIRIQEDGKKVLFPNLEEMMISNMNKLNRLWCCQQDISPSSFRRLGKISIRNCPALILIFPCGIPSTTQSLEILNIIDCKSLEQIFDLRGVKTHGGTSALSVAVNQQQETEVPRLPNLEEMHVLGCERLKYLLPASIAKGLGKLRKLAIEKCLMMEEIITVGDNAHPSFNKEVMFPNLEEMITTDLDKLKRIWCGQQLFAPNSFQRLRKIEIGNCPKLISIFPCYIRTNWSLQKLAISDCKSLEQIFDLQGVNARETQGGTSALPLAIKQQPATEVSGLLDMEEMHVKGCERIKYLFPTSVAKRLGKLRKLVVENCSMMKEIIMIEDKAHPYFNEEVLFPNLEEMIISNMNKLNRLWCCQQDLSPSSFRRLGKIWIRNCPALILIFPCGIPSTTQSLEILNIIDCKSLEQIFDLRGAKTHGGTSALGVAVNQQQETEVPRLPNLEEMCVLGCEKLKYVLPASIAKSLGKLRKLEIEKCLMMEEIITVEDNAHPSFNKEVVFSNLEDMILIDMDKLGTICGLKQQLAPNSFGRLRKIMIRNCEGLSKGLPLSFLKLLNNLEELELESCKSLNVVFDLEEGIVEDQAFGVLKSTLRKLILTSLPNLNQLWNKDPQGIIDFQSLSVINAVQCESMKYLFPASVSKTLTQLKELKIEFCAGLEYIVAMEEGNDTSIHFVFPEVIHLCLWDLPKLESFYPRQYTTEWPSLETMDYTNIHREVNIFGSKLLGIQEAHCLGRFENSFRLPFTAKKAIPNLKDLTLDCNEAIMTWLGQYSLDYVSRIEILRLQFFHDLQTWFPYSFLQRMSNLKSLVVAEASFEELFSFEKRIHEGNQNGSALQLKKLSLQQLPKLRHICKGDELDPYIKQLEELIVEECPNLLNLLPSSATFNHLTSMEVYKCEGLLYFITSSTARSLGQLEKMVIKECRKLKEIVADKAADAEMVNEITFSRLLTLQLISLPCLESFCSRNYIFNFPSLEDVDISESPRMKIFSGGISKTPKLHYIRGRREIHWEGELNSTVMKFYTNKVGFQDIQHLKLDEFSEFNDPRCKQLPDRLFKNLTSLKVENLEFLSIVIPYELLKSLNNLQELDIQNCSSVKIVFDMEEICNEDTNSKVRSQLKKLTISNLPNLKHVWNHDPQQFVTFDDLNVVHIGQCESLKSLIPATIAKNLLQLEDLRIYSCGIEEIVAKEGDDGSDALVTFVFPKVVFLGLWNLPNLKCFYPGTHTTEWSGLRRLDINIASPVDIFGSELQRHDETNLGKEQDYVIQHPPFSHKKVFPNLETLSVDSGISWLHKFSLEYCGRLKHLGLLDFHEEAKIPNWILESIPYLEELALVNSSFKEMLPHEGFGVEIDHESDSFLVLKRLTLWRLPKLERIYKNGYDLDKCLENLQYLWIGECCGLKNLVPSLVSFNHLEYLEVLKCDGLLHLVTSSTAKSFVQLTTLKIKECKMIKEILASEANEVSHEIIFSKLKYLKLQKLPSLESFCSGNCELKFPLLQEVIVRQCPKMKTFSQGNSSTASLLGIKVEKAGGTYWEDNLNGTIQKIYTDMYGF